MWMSDRGRTPGPSARLATTPAATDEQLADAVRLVEDAIDATSSCGMTTERTGPAIVDALLEVGWSLPPAPAPEAPPGQVLDALYGRGRRPAKRGT